LRAIAKRTNLLNPEAVKSYLASADLSENRKGKLTHDLSRFYKWKHIPFQKPTYGRVEMLPFVPLESEVDQLISGLGSKTATFLQVLKKTGMRAGRHGIYDGQISIMREEQSTLHPRRAATRDSPAYLTD
jgi:hypothetical protein